MSKIPLFPDVFTRDRFFMMFWRLYFSHEKGSARDLKIRPVVNKIHKKNKFFYCISSHVSADESKTYFNGKIVFRV